MTTLYFATSAGLGRAVVPSRKDTSSCAVSLVMGKGPVTTISIDPKRPTHLYATTRGHGLWRSRDRGVRWERAGEGITLPMQTCSVVSPSDRQGDLGAIYVGTVGPGLYRSTDGGETFTEIKTLDGIPSRREWSFPPIPDTCHVQALAADETDPARIFVGIEVGGVMVSGDAGASWADHQQDAEADPHILLSHPRAPGRIYEGGGGSYCESPDSGRTWTREVEGFADDIRYFYSIAVDPVDPDTVLMVCGRDHITGHRLIPNGKRWATLYRKQKGVAWHELREGLPDRDSHEMGYLAADGSAPGLFYYTTVDGRLFRTRDHGTTWQAIALTWPNEAAAPVISRLTAQPDDAA